MQARCQRGLEKNNKLIFNCVDMIIAICSMSIKIYYARNENATGGKISKLAISFSNTMQDFKNVVGYNL